MGQAHTIDLSIKMTGIYPTNIGGLIVSFPMYTQQISVDMHKCAQETIDLRALIYGISHKVKVKPDDVIHISNTRDSLHICNAKQEDTLLLRRKDNGVVIEKNGETLKHEGSLKIVVNQTVTCEHFITLPETEPRAIGEVTVEEMKAEVAVI